MKKISTLIVASLLTVAAMAADRRPSVTIQSTRNFEVVIDGKSYSGGNISSMTLTSLREGYHTVTVYKKSNRGFFFMKNKRMISSTSFMLRNNDVNICVDQFGKVQVIEIKKGRDDRGWDQKDRDKGSGKDYRKDNDDHNKRF